MTMLPQRMHEMKVARLKLDRDLSSRFMLSHSCKNLDLKSMFTTVQYLYK